jgi:HD-like signal output (HDOD) protein
MNPIGFPDDLREMDALLNWVGQLHSAPQIAQRVLKLTSDVQFDVREVVSCLESDPALAARILRVVNSSNYGLARRVTNLPQAVAFMGQRALRMVTMTFSLVETLTHGEAGRLYYDYWRRALTTAVVASRLAQLKPQLDRDVVYSAGLLADLGILALAQDRGEAYTALYQRQPHGPELVAAEREAFAFGHPALGAHLLRRWGFPLTLIEAAARHHDESPDPVPLEAAVRAGNLMADVLWTPQSPHLASVRLLLMGHFNLNLDGFIGLARDCKNDVLLNAELFGFQLQGKIDCEALLAQARQQHLDVSLEVAMELDSLIAVYDSVTRPPK